MTAKDWQFKAKFTQFHTLTNDKQAHCLPHENQSYIWSAMFRVNNHQRKFEQNPENGLISIMTRKGSKQKTTKLKPFTKISAK